MHSVRSALRANLYLHESHLALSLVVFVCTQFATSILTQMLVVAPWIVYSSMHVSQSVVKLPVLGVLQFAMLAVQVSEPFRWKPSLQFEQRVAWLPFFPVLQFAIFGVQTLDPFL